MPGFSTLPWKISRCLACSTGRSAWLPESIPPWCRFFQSLSVHMQICRRDSHRCRTSPEARSPETPDGTKQSVTDVGMTSCPARVGHSSYLFLCGLRVENLVHFKNTRLSFIEHTEWGLVVGICGHHHRLALVLLLVLLQHRLHAAQHPDVACKHRNRFITFPPLWGLYFSADLWVPPAARGTSCAAQPLSCISQEDLCWLRTSR